MTFKVNIRITLRPSILDPQGKAVAHALQGLGFNEVEGARQGKVIEMNLAETDEAAARAKAEEMCEKLLANPVMENYSIEILA